MPRGVAVTEPRQRLFAALEQVIAATGPGRLTSRAVTSQAGVATGLLYAHFTNLDQFLTGYAVDRAFQISAGLAGLTQRAGTGTVAGNLSEAVLATPPSTLLALTRLLACRPELDAAVDQVLGAGNAGLQAITRASADYLAAEQRLGRVSAAVDTHALATAVVGTLHHIVLIDGTDPASVDRVRVVVTALVDGFTAAARP